MSSTLSVVEVVDVPRRAHLGAAGLRTDGRYRLSDLGDGLVAEIESFFETYDRLNGKEFHPIGRRGPRVARRLLDEATT